MSRLYVCPLDALEDTLEQSKAQTVLCLSGPEQKIERPRQAKDGFVNLVFNDIIEARKDLVEPQEHHIKKMLGLFEGWSQEAPIICCCWMGVSRSTAAAAIACAALSPQLSEKVVAENLRRNAPFANPNSLMIKLADVALGRKGKLVKAFEELAPPKQVGVGTPFMLEMNQETNQEQGQTG